MMSLKRAGIDLILKESIGRSYPVIWHGLPRSFSIQQQWLRRSVHQTPKKEHTTLFSSDKLSTFNVLSLKALKGECRSRGLKVSGRKMELIDRILTFENSGSSPGSISSEAIRLLHTSRPKQATGDSKPVDAVKIPNIAATEASLNPPEKDYIVKIPPLTKTAAQKAVTKLEKELDSRSEMTNEPPKVSTLDHDKVIFQAEAPDEKVEIVNEEAEMAAENKASIYTNSESSEKDLNNKDKAFLLGFAATVAGWWSLKYLGKKEKGKE